VGGSSSRVRAGAGGRLNGEEIVRSTTNDVSLLARTLAMAQRTLRRHIRCRTRSRTPSPCNRCSARCALSPVALGHALAAYF
jgi:hypothetical protein